MKLDYYLYLAITTVFSLDASRSPFRRQDTTMPQITTQWTNENQQYHLKNYYLEEEAIFKKFDKAHIMSHLLPNDAISYRYNPEKSVSGEVLSKLAEEVLVEIQQHKRKYKNFKILKNEDFNPRTASGSLILKFNDYPFVLKIFMETPRTFVRPFSKGIINSIFFIMGGGATRYLSGFLRLKNLEAAQALIDDNPYLKNKIFFPRKWFFMPSHVRWFYIKGNNIGPSGKELVIEVPSVYMIVTDWISFKKPFSIFNSTERQIGTCIANYLGNRIDAHIDNFVEEYVPEDATLPAYKALPIQEFIDKHQLTPVCMELEKIPGRIGIIDTEHFPTMLGLKKPLRFTNYSSWYGQISAKCFNDCFLKHKVKRSAIQKQPVPVIMPC